MSDEKRLNFCDIKLLFRSQSYSKGCGVCRRHFHEAFAGIRATSKLELSALGAVETCKSKICGFLA